MSRDEIDARAVRVRALLADADLRAALDSIETDFLAEWRASRDPQERENCWHAVRIMDCLRTYLNSMATSDKTALRRSR